MKVKTIFSLVAFVFLAIGFWGCAKEQKAEVPKQEQVTKNLVPSKVDVKGQNFSLDISDLKVAMDVDTATKDIVDTPNLRGDVKIINTSKDILDIQAVTLEYLDAAGKPIPFKSGEKEAKASMFIRAIKPGESADGSLDVTIPRDAVKDNALSRIEVNLVYVPSPIRQEVLDFSEKLG